MLDSDGKGTENPEDVKGNVQENENPVEQPPMESAGEGTKQPDTQPENVPPTGTVQEPPMEQQQPEAQPEPIQEQPQVEYPKNKQGKPEYDQIDNPNVFAQALLDEWGDEALDALDDYIADTKDGFDNKKAMEKRRINKRLAMLEQARGILSPNEETETPTETPAEPVAETQEEPKEETKPYQLSDEVDENGRQFVLNSSGEIVFGQIGEETGLTPAPNSIKRGCYNQSKDK